MPALNAMNLILCSVLGVLLVPVTFLLVEVLSALRKGRERDKELPKRRPSIVVLVPAHDEEKVLGHALRAILPQLEPSDRLVVVADNCSDSTSEVARSHGATVVERQDPVRIGKGYALDFGARYLEADPPEVVVVIDADCIPEDGAISQLARAAASSGGPVQAAYLMTAPAGSQEETQLREGMVLLKNLVRPLGLERLNLPCLLTGSGMAFPWPLFRKAPLANGNRVDDMQLAVDMAIAGAPPRFCPGAHVLNLLPAEPGASRVQRSGWMQGHLRTLVAQVPRLLSSAFRLRRPDLAILALELSVPPLSMLILLWTLASVFTLLVCWGGGIRWPLVAVAYGTVALAVAGGLFWTKFGRARVPAKALLAMPLLFRQSIIAAFAAAFTRPKPWVRTSR